MSRAAEYLVVDRQSQWWIMHDGFRRGPFISRQVAIDSAILAAKVDVRAGRQARVSVQDGREFATVYDSVSR